MLRMKKDDLMFFYHSSTKPAGVAGIGRIVREAYPDPTAFDPRIAIYPKASRKSFVFMVDVAFVNSRGSDHGRQVKKIRGLKRWFCSNSQGCPCSR